MGAMTPIGRQHLYQTHDSLKTAIETAQARLPITDENTLKQCLMEYHNTLISQLDRGQPHER